MAKNTPARTVGLVLVAAYSVLMMATAGTAAAWSWLILAAGIALIAINVPRRSTEKEGGRDG